jgi:N-acetylglucosaminyldiphosphoundecaprenol N-acetyl-beta-D-mannosaminyltransferase
MEAVKLLNGHFHKATMLDTIAWCIEAAKSDKPTYLCTVNVAILMMMRDNPRLQQYIDRSGFVVADGTPILWACNLFGQPLPERVTGVDLIPELCAAAIENDLGIYFLGAEQEIIDAFIAKIREDHPKLKISGHCDGYFDLKNCEDRKQVIRESGASILIVGMGVPRQDYFIEENLDDMGVSLAIGVGGSFDVVAGLRKRAPSILQKTGTEWLYRLIQEPRRLFWRYFTTNSTFIYLVIKQLLFGKKA